MLGLKLNVVFNLILTRLEKAPNRASSFQTVTMVTSLTYEILLVNEAPVNYSITFVGGIGTEKGRNWDNTKSSKCAGFVFVEYFILSKRSAPF